MCISSHPAISLTKYESDMPQYSDMKGIRRYY